MNATGSPLPGCPDRRPLRREAAIAALLVIGAIILPLVPGGPARRAAATEPLPYTVTATPTTGLTDGQRVTINIKTDSTFPIYQAEARVCRSGVTYQPGGGNRPNADFELGGPNCPADPVTSSADLASVDTNVLTQSQSPAGNPMSIRVGAGSTSWPVDAPINSLTCDADHPCTLVVELLGGPSGTWVPWTTPLTYRVDDPIAGCGGPAPGAVASGGSDRITDAWVDWTLAECKQPGRTGAAAKASFSGEGAALQSYSTGALDLSYTAAGYDDKVALIPSDAGVTPRASVPVPLALNATVIAVAGGIRDADGQKLGYGPIKLTLDEAAALIGGGDQGIVPYLDAISKRNPELAVSFFDYSTGVQAGAFADSEATSYFGSNLFSTLRPEAYRVPELAVFGSDAGRLRGADANLAVADPSYAGALSLLTGRSSLQKIVNSINPSVSGGVWLLTDAATAQSLGLTIVELQNANGQFVGPTPESMAAAVPTMKADADGMLIPDPTAPAPSTSAVQPYPLTFVEYGLAPTAPLADATTNDCRTESQALLSGWLTYLTTAGQTVLPAGFQALPADLKAQAATAIAKVGATPAPTPCTVPGAPPTTVDTTPTDPAAGVGDPSFPSGSGRGGFASSGSSSSSAVSGPGAVTPAADQTELAAARATVPDYGGSSLASGLAAAAAIFGIIILTAAAAKATAGRGPGDPSGGSES